MKSSRNNNTATYYITTLGINNIIHITIAAIQNIKTIKGILKLKTLVIILVLIHQIIKK